MLVNARYNGAVPGMTERGYARSAFGVFMLLALLFACEVPPPPSSKPASSTSSCELDVNKLGGTMWMYNKPNDAGGFTADPAARMRFRDDNGALFADYTAGSQGSVYAYSCSVKGSIGTCIETNNHADAFCKAYAATHDGVCDPAAVATSTGIPLEEVTKVAETVNAELKKLSKTEAETQRKADNSPNNKIRGKFLFAVDKASCGLTIQDKYQTMVDGKLNEYENVIGAGKFVKADQDYTFESCEDVDSSWAPGPDDKHLAVQPAGTIKFAAIYQKKELGGGGCTYSADIYKDWVKSQADVPSVLHPKDGPRIDVSVPFATKGKHVVYFDRYKTCGDKKEKVGLTCAMVRIE